MPRRGQRKLQPPAQPREFIDSVSPSSRWDTDRHRRQPQPSMILDDGKYEPSENGQVNLRRSYAEQLFSQHPVLRRAVQKHPASQRFHEEASLRFGDVVSDGFRARFSREVLLVDSRLDADLREFLSTLRIQLRHHGLEERIAMAARAVCNAFGGCASDIDARWRKRCDEINMPPPADTLLGKLLSREVAGRLDRPGAGICRHRAILFKYVCDALRITECAVLTGVVAPPGAKNIESLRRTSPVDHMWNVVRAEGTPYLMDCMFHPGELLAAQDLENIAIGVIPGTPYSYHRIRGRAGLLSLDVV